MLDNRPVTFSSMEEDEVVVPPQTPPEQGPVPVPEKAAECLGMMVREEEEEKGDGVDKQEKNDKNGSGGGGDSGGSGLSSAVEEGEEWFGCSFCENRWFQKMSLLESHYSKEHEGATSYQFELLELKKCVILLPHIKEVIDRIPETGEDLNQRFSALTLSGRRGSGGDGNGRKVKRKGGGGARLMLSAMAKGIRKAIKATQGDGGNGSSYRRIKEYLINKMGMETEQLHRRLRRVLERFVEMGKLNRRFCLGKTLYSLRGAGGEQQKIQEGEQEDRVSMPKMMMPTEEKRRFRDHQLKQLAKNLRPHDLLDHE